MGDRRDADRPGPLALRILAEATIDQMRDDCDELAELFAALSEGERARLMDLLFGDQV